MPLKELSSMTNNSTESPTLIFAGELPAGFRLSFVNSAT